MSKQLSDEGEENVVPLNNVELIKEEFKDSVKDICSEKVDEPLMSSPEWSDFVFQQFEEDELDPDGNPFVHGLRRVGRLLLGPILYSGAEPFQAPAFVGGNLATMLQPAVAKYTLTILMVRLEEGQVAYQMTFSDIADCYIENTDPDFARHPSAMASTRAEARCWRKALQLKKPSAEEITKVPVDLSFQTGKITSSQVNFINVLCKRNDISVLKFINMGKKKYNDILDIDYGVAASMTEFLSGLQNTGKCDEKIKGYDPEWNK